MSVFADPRVTRVDDDGESYEIRTEAGTWVVLQIGGRWVAAPPPRAAGGFRGDPTSDEAYRLWEDALPRFSSAEAAVGAVLR